MNMQPTRPPVLTRHTHRTRFPCHHPPWTGGLGGEHAKGQKVKGSGEGGEARRNGRPGWSHRDVGSNPSPAGYKLWDLSQLLSLGASVSPAAVGGDRASRASWRAEPTARQKGESWVFLGGRWGQSLPSEVAGQLLSLLPSPSPGRPSKERRLELLQDHPADTRQPIPPCSVHRLPPGTRQHRSQWAGCLTWVRIVQLRFSDPS